MCPNDAAGPLWHWPMHCGTRYACMGWGRTVWNGQHRCEQVAEQDVVPAGCRIQKRDEGHPSSQKDSIACRTCPPATSMLNSGCSLVQLHQQGTARSSDRQASDIKFVVFHCRRRCLFGFALPAAMRTSDELGARSPCLAAI